MLYPMPRTIFCLAVFLLSATALAADANTAQPRPENPREMFRRLGVEDSYFDQFADLSPMGMADVEPLLRVLFRLRNFPAVDLDNWAKGINQLALALAHPARFRGEIFRLRGRVQEVTPLRPLDDAARRYELARYYRCRLKIEDTDQWAEIYTEHVPEQWRKGAKPDAQAGATGVFLKLAEPNGKVSTAVFAAPRLAWYPQNLLGRLGMDCGLLDTVENQKPITVADREAFYQMLAAVGRARPGLLLEAADRKLAATPDDLRWTDREGQQHFSVVPLFNQPDAQRGELFALSGTARRIEKIIVDDPDIVARLGIDHYYQVFLFTDDSQGNPLTFCIRELPEGMAYGNVPRYGEAVRIAGFFFKTWSYAVPQMADPTEASPQRGARHQLSPLLIGRSLVWYSAPEPSQSSMTNTIVIVAVLIATAAIWAAAWRSSRREKARSMRLRNE